MVWTGKAQWVVVPCKVWLLSRLYCLRKLQRFTFCYAGQLAGRPTGPTLIITWTHFSCESTSRTTKSRRRIGVKVYFTIARRFSSLLFHYLYHVFIDFKKAFDRVWHAALWATMKKYSISTNLIQVIKNLYNKATNTVLFNGSIGDWFRTTVGVRQGCLLSSTLFNIFLKDHDRRLRRS